jgi:prophage maintenance system killer protein
LTLRKRRRKQSEGFLPEEVELMILENMMTVEERKEVFGVDREILSYIINRVNSFNDIADKRTRIIKKAAQLLVGMSYGMPYQPFKEGNKETGLAWTIVILERNGFKLPLETTTELNDIYELMENTGRKMEGDTTIISEVEEYLGSRMVSF